MYSDISVFSSIEFVSIYAFIGHMSRTQNPHFVILYYFKDKMYPNYVIAAAFAILESLL